MKPRINMDLNSLKDAFLVQIRKSQLQLVASYSLDKLKMG